MTNYILYQLNEQESYGFVWSVIYTIMNIMAKATICIVYIKNKIIYYTGVIWALYDHFGIRTHPVKQHKSMKLENTIAPHGVPFE